MKQTLFSALPDALMAPLFGEGPRRKILEATARLVSEKGFHALTVQDILVAAGVSRRTFYRAFDSKEDALRALFEIATSLFLYLIETAVRSAPSPETQLIRAVETYLDLQLSGGRLIVTLQEEALGRDSLLAPRRQEILGRLIQLLDESHHALTGEHVDPLVLRTLLLGMEGLVMHLQRDGALTARDRDRVRDVFMPILVRTLAPPGMALPPLTPAPKKR